MVGDLLIGRGVGGDIDDALRRLIGFSDQIDQLAGSVTNVGVDLTAVTQLGTATDRLINFTRAIADLSHRDEGLRAAQDL